MRALLVTMALLLLLAPVGLAQDAGGNQTGNETAGNETGGDQAPSDGGDGGQAGDGGDGADRPMPDEPLQAPAAYTITVYLGDTPQGSQPFTIHPDDITVSPGSEVTFHVVNVGSVDHDLTFLGLQDSSAEFDDGDLSEREDGGEAVKTPLLAAGESYDLTVTFPGDETGSFTYICSVPGHRESGMEGTLHVGGAAGGEEEITELGVDYLAYWVGIVSFVILFVVLFGTFFLFRYGESKEVVDHRTGAPTVTSAASQAETETPAEEEGFLPDPGRLAIVLALIAIVLWGLTEFTSIFGG